MQTLFSLYIQNLTKEDKMLVLLSITVAKKMQSFKKDKMTGIKISYSVKSCLQICQSPGQRLIFR